MANGRLLTALLFGAVAWPAEQSVTVSPGKDAETHIVLAGPQKPASTYLWVHADPNVISVTVLGPDGRRWTQADLRKSAPVKVLIADARSGSLDEVQLAGSL